MFQGRMFSEATFEPVGSSDRVQPCPLTYSLIYSTSIYWPLLWTRCLAMFCPSDIVIFSQVTFFLALSFSIHQV